MKKATNKSAKKKIYLVNLDCDCGELWLDENKQPLKWIHCNDATFRSEYQSFIIEYLGGKLIELSPDIKDYDLLVEADCMESVYEIVKKYL